MANSEALENLDDNTTSSSLLASAAEDPHHVNCQFDPHISSVEMNSPNSMQEENVESLIGVENDVTLDNVISSEDEPSEIVITDGMTFPTFEEIEKLYKSYAKSKGFGVRRRNTRKNAALLVCNREGHHKSKKESTVTGDNSGQKSSRITKSSRIGCGASLHCALNAKSEVWRITKFNDSHNHDLVTPKSNKYLRTHKKVTTTARALSEAFDSQGISIGTVFNILNAGPDEVAFTKKDCYNHIAGVRRKILDNGDANAVQKYCIRQQQENPDFRYSILLDDDDRMTNFFWVDGRSRKAYEIFGDVVSFDTTYRTNKYNMPFAPFVGINNHMQTTVFGCALLQDETEESFIWLFESWLDAMDGKHPISFITDQDKAMMNAVAKVFPTTKHRLCLWHIIKKFPERLSHIYHDKSAFKTKLARCIHESVSTFDFEMAWQQLLIDYELNENEWLHNLYSMRHLWVPCFNKDVFFGGMNTTGRSESINAFFDAFIRPGMTLKELVIKCEEALDSRYEAFRRAEFDSKYKVPVFTLDMSLEKHAGSVYTSEIFKLFHNELRGILGCRREKKNEENTKHIYQVVGASDLGKGVQVVYDTTTKECSCECKLFEFKGILCKHILSIYYVHNVDRIPSTYIMRRWTKDVADPIFTYKVKSRARSLTSLESFQLKESIDELYDICELSEDVVKYVRKRIDEVIVSTKQEFSDLLGIESREEGNTSFQENQFTKINDPNVTQTKGRKRASTSKEPRIRSGLEEASKHTNRCSNCNKTNHNKRRCPELRNQL